MYYKRVLPIKSAVYRPLESQRYLVMDSGGQWPVLDRLPNGDLGVVARDGNGQRGRLVFLTSPDGGESWSHTTVISGDGSDNRNPAFGVTPDGTLLASFIKQVNYTDGYYDIDRGIPTPLYISRSEDNGATWSTSLAVVDGQESWRVGSPFGRMIRLPDGAVLMPCHTDETSYLIRSHDGGRTWVDPVTIAEGVYNETSVCDLGDGRMLAVMRNEDTRGIAQSDSEDGGYTWTEPRELTGRFEHPGDVIRLLDGRLLLTWGHRTPPFGVQGMLSADDGKTWDDGNRILLVGDSRGGYPSTIQRDDGAIVTVYYSSDLYFTTPLRSETLGVHAAAVVYRPEDL